MNDDHVMQKSYCINVSDPLHFDLNPDPLQGIVDPEFQFFFLLFFCKRYNTNNDVFLLSFMSLLCMCIKQKVIP